MLYELLFCQHCKYGINASNRFLHPPPPLFFGIQIMIDLKSFGIKSGVQIHNTKYKAIVGKEKVISFKD